MSISTRKKVLDFKKMLSHDIENDDIKIEFNSRLNNSSKNNSNKKNNLHNTHIAINNGNNSINNNNSAFTMGSGNNNMNNANGKSGQLLGKKRKGKQMHSCHSNDRDKDKDGSVKVTAVALNMKMGGGNDKGGNNVNSSGGGGNKILRKEYEDMLMEYEDELKYLESGNVINNKNFPWINGSSSGNNSVNNSSGSVNNNNNSNSNNVNDIEINNNDTSGGDITIKQIIVNNNNEQQSNSNIINNTNNNNNNSSSANKTSTIKKNTPSTDNKNTEMKPSNIITDLNTLNYNLFLCTKFENSKPYKMIDYIISNDPLLLNRKGDNEKLEEIKKPIFSKCKTDINNNINILYKSLYEYFKTDFSSSFIYSLFEKVNHILQTKSEHEPPTQSEDKKDKFTYSSIISERLKQNKSQSTLFSYTNDIDFVKSLIYLNNKFNKYLNKKNKIEKNLSQALKANLAIVDNLINNEQKEGNLNNEEQKYLHKLTRSKKFFIYICKNFSSFTNSLHTLQQCKLSKRALFKLIEIVATKSKEDEFDKTAKLFNEFQMNHSKTSGSGGSSSSNNNNPVLLDKVQVKNIWIGIRFLFFLFMMSNRSNCNSEYIENGFWKEIYEFTIKKIVAERHVKESSNGGEDRKGVISSKEGGKVRNNVQMIYGGISSIGKGDEGKHEVKFQVPKVNLVYVSGSGEQKERKDKSNCDDKNVCNTAININNILDSNSNNKNVISNNNSSGIKESNVDIMEGLECNNQSLQSNNNNIITNKKHNNNNYYSFENLKSTVIERYDKGLDIFTIIRDKHKNISKHDSDKKETSSHTENNNNNININNINSLSFQKDSLLSPNNKDQNNDNNNDNDNDSSSSKTISEEDDDGKKTQKQLHLSPN